MHHRRFRGCASLMRVLHASCPRSLLAQGIDEFRSIKSLANFVSMSMEIFGEVQGLLKWNWAAGANLMVMPSWIVDISGFNLGFAISLSNVPSKWVKGLFYFLWRSVTVSQAFVVLYLPSAR
jgi:hypothetical protein